MTITYLNAKKPWFIDSNGPLDVTGMEMYNDIMELAAAFAWPVVVCLPGSHLRALENTLYDPAATGPLKGKSVAFVLSECSGVSLISVQLNDASDLKGAFAVSTLTFDAHPKYSLTGVLLGASEAVVLNGI